MMLHLALIVCMLPGSPAAEAADETAADDLAVKVARDVLGKKNDLPWYDAQQDALRPIRVVPTEDDQHRQSDWASERTPRNVPAHEPAGAWSLLQVLAWTALALLLAAVMGFLVWAARRMDVGGLAHEKAVARATVGPERMEDLPMALPVTDQNLLAAARACREAGDYGMAIIYAYAYQLMELDRHHAIELRKGKTNRQYLRELRARPGLRDLLRDTMLAFEEVFFGHHTLSRPQFEHCWAGLDEFHRRLEQLA